jgi:hypothetical protein
MWQQTSILSDVLGQVMGLWSSFLDYFATGGQLTHNGNLLAGSITDIIRSIAEFSSHLHILLGNHV